MSFETPTIRAVARMLFPSTKAEIIAARFSGFSTFAILDIMLSRSGIVKKNPHPFEVYPRPKPPFRPKPKPERFERAKQMTLVAGFLCSDGYVVAADTEVTYDPILYQGKKLASYDGEGLRYRLRVGYAGDASYGTMLSQKIRDAVDNLGLEPKFPDMKAAVEEVVCRVHEEQIFKVWAATGLQDPRVELIVVMEDIDHKAGILRAYQNAVYQVMKYAFIGTGSYLAECIAEKLIGERSMSTAVTHHLVHQLFREVKGKGAFVGGNTEIVSRVTLPQGKHPPKLGEGERFFDLGSDDDKRFLWGLDQNLLSAVRLALRHNSYRKLFDDRLDFIRIRLEELWGWAHQTNIPREVGDERETKVLDTEWDNPFEDV